MSELIPVAVVCVGAIFLMSVGDNVSAWFRSRRENR